MNKEQFIDALKDNGYTLASGSVNKNRYVRYTQEGNNCFIARIDKDNDRWSFTIWRNKNNSWESLFDMKPGLVFTIGACMAVNNEWEKLKEEGMEFGYMNREQFNILLKENGYKSPGIKSDVYEKTVYRQNRSEICYLVGIGTYYVVVTNALKMNKMTYAEGMRRIVKVIEWLWRDYRVEKKLGLGMTGPRNYKWLFLDWEKLNGI